MAIVTSKSFSDANSSVILTCWKIQVCTAVNGTLRNHFTRALQPITDEEERPRTFLPVRLRNADHRVDRRFATCSPRILATIASIKITAYW